MLLVTSAYHMRHAQVTFHAAGIQAIPAAMDYEVQAGWELTLQAKALKEYLGLLVYRWRGWAY